MKNVLALDLGTNTGWCVGTPEQHVSGVWNLKPSRFESSGMRFVKFRAELNKMREAFHPEMVYFEEVRRHAGTTACQIYGGFLAILTEWCDSQNIPYEGVPVGEIKKSFAGRGNADKAAMITEACRRGYSPISDDEADALAIFALKAGVAD